MKNQLLLFDPTDAEAVERMNLGQRIQRAIDLLRANEPPEGYYLAYSGGKDSTVILELAKLSGVKFEPFYNNTTIDPPDLVRFIKHYHPEVRWNQPPKGPMFYRIANSTKMPPSRSLRWCCGEFKERGGKGRVKIFGVRAAESKGRKTRWREATISYDNMLAICPIVYWLHDQVWEFIKTLNIPYCSLYDEGFDRLGCIGCPLVSKELRKQDFAKYPKYELLWKRAVIKNWEKWHDVINSHTGLPRFSSQFKTGEDFYAWWLVQGDPDLITGRCQAAQLWTNIPGVNDDEL